MQAFQEELETLRNELGQETAIVSHIDGETYTIILTDSVVPAFSPGDTFELKDTFCADVTNEKRTMVYNNVSSISSLLLHPCYVVMQLLAYIGAPIVVDGKVWGTLNFSSTSARDIPFSDDDIRKVEDLANRISQSLSTKETEAMT